MRKILLVSGVLLLTACGSYSPLNWLTPHTIDVQQGNYVTQDVVDKLQPGMTQAQAIETLRAAGFTGYVRGQVSSSVRRGLVAGQRTRQAR